MTNGHSSVGRDSNRSGRTVPRFTLEELRERAIARRRRTRQNRRQSAKWVVNRSRREKVRTLAVCAGALLLMALGLYFGLAHQEGSSPVESVAPVGAVSIV
jgi:hypothetical protein